MKTAIVLCLLASTLYAAEITLTDKRLEKVSPVVLLFFLGLMTCLVTLPMVLWNVRKGELVFPDQSQWIILGIVLLLGVAGDWAHFSALHFKSGGIVLATFYMLLPVLCSIFEGQRPSWKTIIAWGLGAVALFLISTNNGEIHDG